MQTLEQPTPATVRSGGFPIGRTLIALVVVPLFTAAVFWIPIVVSDLSSSEILIFSKVVVVSAWPGALIFLLLGLPTYTFCFGFAF